MTNEEYEKATKILHEIEKLKRVSHWMYYNPFIADSKDRLSDGMYISCIDEDKELREIIRQWIKNRINKLEQDFNDL